MSLAIPENTPFRSQHGEDRVLAEHFGHKRHGTFVEVGATDGEVFSNTYFFEHTLGWSGVLIEADPEQAEECRRRRPGSIVIDRAVVAPADAGKVLTLQVVDGYAPLSSLGLTKHHRKMIDLVNEDPDYHAVVREIQVPSQTLDQALDEAAIEEIDFMSIDVEGHEAEVLEGFALGSRWRPRVLLVESARGFPELVVARRLFTAGYGYRRSIEINDWYEPEPSVVRRLLGLTMQFARGAGRHLRHAARRTVASLRERRAR